MFFFISEDRPGIVADINNDYKTLQPLSEELEQISISLLEAVDTEDTEAIKTGLQEQPFLLDTGVGVIALHSAIATGNNEAVIFILNHSFFLRDQIDTNGNTALHIACAFGYLQIVKELVEKGAEVNVENYRKETPFLIACSLGSSPSYHLRTNRKSNCKRQYAYLEIVEFLLDKVNLRETHLGDLMPLHHAAAGSNSQIVQIIVEDMTKEGISFCYQMIFDH